jgi:hypothetical protein
MITMKLATLWFAVRGLTWRWFSSRYMRLYLLMFLFSQIFY